MLEEDIIKQEVNKFVDKIKDKELNIDQSQGYKVIKENPKFEIKYAMDMNKLFRFCAKVAFNVSTYLNGKEFMLNECFDGIREAIISGKNINDYVSLCPENPLAKTFDSLYYKEKYGEYLHSVICLKQENGYYAVVSFYGFITGVLVKLTDNLNVRPVTATNGFFCDWENRKEYDMINFIVGLDSNEGECHKVLCCKEKRKI